MIATIDIDQLFKLCSNDSNLISLFDRLKTTRFRVKYNLLDDLDYFTFPNKFVNHKHIEENEDMMDDEYFH